MAALAARCRVGCRIDFIFAEQGTNCTPCQLLAFVIWTFIKPRRCDSSVAPLRRSGTTSNDSKAKANILNDRFVSVLMNHLDKKGVLSNLQHGFRKVM